MADKDQVLLKAIQQQRRDLSLPALLKRQFQKVTVGIQDTPSSNCQQTTLRIMQWNLLAQALSQGDDNFVRCPPDALSWDHRKLHIMEEILAYQATIICLEEVDHFQFFRDILAQAGYDGCFFPKPNSPCLYSDINYGPDGCAMFWKTDDVSLEAQKGVVLKDDSGKETNQVAVISRFFSDLIPGKKICVAVTHLKSKTPYWQLRHEQGKYLESILRENTPENVPLIICGDFNAEPSELVYAAFQSSTLGLDSAYRHLSNNLEEPSYTTWKIRGGPSGNSTEIAHCIDYIWFSTKHLLPVSILKFPTAEEIGQDRLPSWTYPSDHLSLVIDFAFKG